MSQQQSISASQQQQQAPLIGIDHVTNQQLQSQLRCYLCDTPKQEYSLIRTFSEIVCRGCLNYEGPDKVELLISEARRFKRQQSSPMVKTNSQFQKTTLPSVAALSTAAPGELHNNGTNDKLNRAYIDLNQRMQLVGNEEICALPLHHRLNSINPTLRQSIDRASPINIEVLSMGKGTMNCTNPNCDIDNSINTAGAALNTSGAVWNETQQNRTQQVKPTKAQSKAEKGERTAVECNSAVHEECGDYCPALRRRKNDTTNPQTKPATNKPIRFEPVESPNLISKTEQKQISAAIKSTRSQVVSPNKQQNSTQRPPERITACPPAHTTTNTPPNSTSSLQYVPQQMPTAPMGHRPYATMMPNATNNFNPAEQYLQPRDLTNIDYSQSARLIQKQRATNNPDAMTQAQHYPHDLNAATSLALYAAECANSPYYLRHPQAPNQPTTARLTNTRLPSNGKQHVPQALPSNLYEHHYPIAVGPYMTPSGLAAIYCSTQYHPYHTHHHAAAALAANAGCTSLLTPASSYGNANNTSSGISLGPGASVTSSHQNQARDGCSDKRSPDDGVSPDGLNQTAPEVNLRRLLSCNSDFSPKVSTTENFGDNPLQGNLGGLQKAPNESPVSPSLSQKLTASKNSHDNDKIFAEKVQQYQGRRLTGESKTLNNTDAKIIDENTNSEDGSLIIINKSSTQSCDSNKEDYNEDERSNQTGQLNGTSGKTNDSLSRNNADDSENTMEGDPSWQSDNFTCSIGSMSPQSHMQNKRPALGFTMNRNIGGSNRQLSPSSVSSGHKAGKYKNFESVNVPSPTSPPLATVGAANVTRSQQAARRSQGQTAKDLLGTCPDQQTNNDYITEIEPRSKHNPSMAQQKSDSGGTQASSNQLSPKGTDDKQLRSMHRQPIPPLSAASSSSTPSAQQPSPRHQSNGIDKAHPQARSESATSYQGRCSSNDPGAANHQQPVEPVKTHQYNPLKCMTCKERLEDRHFVQCPSVSAHKFCFACSKKSIEAQQLENKSTKSTHDGVFCPSGNRCFLATEQTPWTFMNSEIETIFRESSRQTGSSQRPNPTNKSNGASGEYDFVPQSGEHQQVSGRGGNQKLKDLMQSYMNNGSNGSNGGGGGKATKKQASRGGALSSELSSSTPQKPYHGSSNKSNSGSSKESAAHANKVA